MTLPIQVQTAHLRGMSRSFRTSRFTFDAPLGHLSPYIADAPLLVELPAGGWISQGISRSKWRQQKVRLTSKSQQSHVRPTKLFSLWLVSLLEVFSLASPLVFFGGVCDMFDGFAMGWLWRLAKHITCLEPSGFFVSASSVQKWKNHAINPQEWKEIKPTKTIMITRIK